LWLWYQPSIVKRALGLVASILLLAGPLHQVSMPIVSAMENARHSDTARVAQISIIQEEISSLERSLEVFRRNSESRTGWLNAIQQNEQRLGEAHKTLKSLLATPRQAAMDWSQQGAILMQGVALVLFQVTAILVITSLSRNFNQQNPGNTHVETLEATHAVSSTSTDGDETQHLRRDTMDVAILATRLGEYLSRKNLTAKEFSTQHMLNPRDISLIRNHVRRKAAGKQVAPPGAIRKIAKILESGTICD